MSRSKRGALSSPYSHDETVREISSFYNFCADLYLPREVLRFPPEGGWENITAERFAFMEKNDTVIDLMRHLPYIDRDCYEGYEVYELTSPVDYAGVQVQKAADAFARGKRPDMSTVYEDPDEGYPELPAHSFVLASETCGGDGWFWILDTEKAIVTLYDGPEMDAIKMHRPPNSDGPETYYLQELKVQNLNDYESHSIQDFFAMLKEKFQNGELVAHEPTSVYFSSRGDDHRRLLADHGWPDVTRFRKEDFMRAVNPDYKGRIADE